VSQQQTLLFEYPAEAVWNHNPSCVLCKWKWHTTHQWVLVRVVATIIVKVTTPSQWNASTIGTMKITCKRL